MWFGSRKAIPKRVPLKKGLENRKGAMSNVNYEKICDLSLKGSEQINEMRRRLRLMTTLYVDHVIEPDLVAFHTRHLEGCISGSKYVSTPAPLEGTRFTCAWGIGLVQGVDGKLYVDCRICAEDGWIGARGVVKPQDDKSSHIPELPGSHVKFAYLGRGAFVQTMFMLFPNLAKSMSYLNEAGNFKL
jgi:hypothetical protein